MNTYRSRADRQTRSLIASIHFLAEMDLGIVTTKLLMLKHGLACEKLTRAQLEGVIDLLKTVQPDGNFPSVDWIERWGGDIVDDLYRTVNVDGKPFTYIKSDTYMKLIWSNPKIRLAIGHKLHVTQFCISVVVVVIIVIVTA